MNNEIKNVKITNLKFLKSKDKEFLNTKEQGCIVKASKFQELNIEYKKFDKEELMNREVLISELSFSNSQYYRKIRTYDRDTGTVYLRFADFTKDRKETLTKNLYKGEMGYLSNTKLKESNIINVNEDIWDIFQHFEGIIKNIGLSESVEKIINNYFSTSDLYNYLPILYFNEEKNKKEWIIPNYEGRRDYTFDYETEIPLLTSKDLFANISDKNGSYTYLLFKKEGIKSYTKDVKKRKMIEADFEFDKDKFYFKSRKYQVLSSMKFANHKVNLEYDNDNGVKEKDIFNIFVPLISSINEEETLKLLKKMSSKKTIKDIQKELKEESVFFQINERSKSNVENKYLFFIENVLSYKNDRLKLSCIYKTKNEKNFYNMNVDYESLNENETIKDFNNEEYRIITSKSAKIVLPKDKDIISYNQKDMLDIKENLVDRIFSGSSYVVSSIFCLNGKYSTNNLIIDLGKKLEYKNNSSNSCFVNADSSKILFHNNDNDLIMINSSSKTFETISYTEKIEEINYQLLELLNLRNKNINLAIYKTDNEIIYTSLFSTKNNDEHLVEKSNENGDFNIKTKIALINNVKQLKFVHNQDIKWFSLKNQKLEMEVNNESKTELIDLEYVFEKNFLQQIEVQNKQNHLRNFLKIENTFQQDTELYFQKKLKTVGSYKGYEKFLKNIKINGVEYSKEASLDFLNNIALFEKPKDINFNIKKDDNNQIIEFINNSNGKNFKYYLIKNKENNIELSYYFNNDIGSTELLKCFKKNEIIKKVYNESVGLNIYFTKNKMFFLNKFKNVDLIEFNYEKTLENPTSLLNDKKSLQFNKDGLMECVFDNQKKLKNIKNITRQNKILKNLQEYDIF